MAASTYSPASAASPFSNDPARAAFHSHAVSWAAIFAGATGTAVLSLVLLLLGTGIGLSLASPWHDEGASATTLGVSTIVWLTIVQILASALGGYLAGRLRARWVSVHSHEAFFRDTAHGFLAWALATLVTATLLSSAVGSIVSGGAKAGAAAVGSAAGVAGIGAAGMAANTARSQPSSGGDPLGYFTDSLLRPTPGQNGSAGNGSSSSNSPAEAGRILAMSLRNGSLSPADSQYLAQLVAQRTGLSTDDAQKRVNDTFTQAQQDIQQAKTEAQYAADKARKASSALALWLVVSLLIGAFTASWAATFGGRQRDSLRAATETT